MASLPSSTSCRTSSASSSPLSTSTSAFASLYPDQAHLILHENTYHSNFLSMHRFGLQVPHPPLLLQWMRGVDLALAQDQFQALVAREELAQDHALLALGVVRDLYLLREADGQRLVGPLLGFLVFLGFFGHLILFEHALALLPVPPRLLLIGVRPLDIVIPARPYLNHFVLRGVVVLPHLDANHGLGVGMGELLAVLYNTLRSG